MSEGSGVVHCNALNGGSLTWRGFEGIREGGQSRFAQMICKKEGHGDGDGEVVGVKAVERFG